MSIIIPDIRDTGCHGSICLVKSVSKNQFSDDIIIKDNVIPKTNLDKKIDQQLTKLTLDNWLKRGIDLERDI